MLKLNMDERSIEKEKRKKPVAYSRGDEYNYWEEYGKCDACGVNEGVQIAKVWADTLDVCGPTNDCGENKKIRIIIKEHVHRDFAINVCKAFGITLIDVDQD